MAMMATKNGSVKVSAMKPKNLSFKKRKDCIKKKTMELSVLCDVKACALIIGPDGKLETWPENCQDVLEVLRAFQNSSSEDCKRMKKVVEVRNEVTMLEAPVPEDPWLPCTSGAIHEGKQGMPSTFDVVRGKEQQGFPLTLDVANQEEHGLPITLNADYQEEQRFLTMLNATDEKYLESEHEIDGWFNWEQHCLDDSTALNESEFDAWMNMDLGCYDDHHTLVNQQDWLNDYLTEQPAFNIS